MSKTKHLITGQKTDILLNDTNIKTAEVSKYLKSIIDEAREMFKGELVKVKKQ